MRKRRFKTQADIDNYVRQGYGHGEGATYMPWVRIQDVSSRGKSRNTRGIKTGRIHHTLSNLEYGYLLLLEFSDEVVDIREQFPIFPTGAAKRIAAELGIRFPVYASTQVPFVMTSDFRITLRNPDGTRHTAIRTCKYEHELLPHPDLTRTIEKLELEKAVLLAEGYSDWKLVTDRAINHTLIDNLDWLHKRATIESGLRQPDLQQRFLDGLDHFDGTERTLSSVIRSVAKGIHVGYTDAVSMFKNLVWHKAITLDIANTRLDLYEALPKLRLNDQASGAQPHRRAA
jgi:hypothetical protein